MGIKPECDNNEYAYDIHIRKNSELMVYHGGTCLLTIGFKGIENGDISFKSKSYGEGYGCDDEFDRLKKQNKVDDISCLGDLVCAFLKKVVEQPKEIVDQAKAVKGKYFKNMMEGYWSSKLSIDYGHNWQPEMEWMIIDREAVLDFGDEVSNSDDYNQFSEQARNIKNDLKRSDERKWGKVTVNAGSRKHDFGNELDFLAIGPKGKLLCIELKHNGSKNSGIYWGSLQAWVYREAFKAQLDNISKNIKTMVMQKVALKLLKDDAKKFLENDFNVVEGILAVTGKINQSSCWEKAIEVNQKILDPLRMIRSEDGLNWEDSSDWK